MKASTIWLLLTVASSFLLSACTSTANAALESRPASDSSIANGRRLIAGYGCGSCHVIPGVPGADATIGPPLERFYLRRYIAGRLWNTPDNLAQWIQDPQQIKPGTAMPNMGISANEARDIAAYLDHQPKPGDWLDH